jgi:hypothetical protein
VSRRDTTVAAAFGAAAVAVAVAIAVTLVVRPGPSAGSAPAQPLAVTLDVALRPAFFGDVVTATARVVVDAESIEAGSVRLAPDFAPYTAGGDPRRSSSRSGQVAVITFRYRLSCLESRCLQPRIRFPATVVHAQREDGTAAQVTASWPALGVTRRVDEAALRSAPVWREQLALPAVSYRRKPGGLLAVLLPVAAALAIAAVVLVAVELRRRRVQARGRAEAVSRLALALALARASMEREPEDRRKALALLARVLGGDQLATTATRLAWSRPQPEAASIETLAAEVEKEVAAS